MLTFRHQFRLEKKDYKKVFRNQAESLSRRQKNFDIFHEEPIQRKEWKLLYGVTQEESFFAEPAGQGLMYSDNLVERKQTKTIQKEERRIVKLLKECEQKVKTWRSLQ